MLASASGRERGGQVIYLPLHFKDHWSEMLLALLAEIRRLEVVK